MSKIKRAVGAPFNDYQMIKRSMNLPDACPEGLTVGQLISRLLKYDLEHKVIMYDPTGTVYPITFVLQDSTSLVAII